MRCLSFTNIQTVAQHWSQLGGSREVELAALEPLLWRDQSLDIADLARWFSEHGWRVSLTTNGALLERYAARLAHSGLTRLRVSWHTLNPERFAQITATGHYARFLRGVESALTHALPVSINRVLIRGLEGDLAEHIAFADQHGLRLKLLDLYQTEDNAAERNQHYLSPQEALAPLLHYGLLHEIEQAQDLRRQRRRYSTGGRGVVEIKLSDTAQHCWGTCQSCPHNADCLEGLADYFRVSPQFSGNFCYRRPELALPLQQPTSELQQALQQQMGAHLSAVLQRAVLRLVLTDTCNFNCGFPGSAQSWCLKQGQSYVFPIRQLTPESSRLRG